MPMQLEQITRKEDGKTTSVGMVGMYIVDIVENEGIATYEATLDNGRVVGSYDTFEEAVEALHEAYDKENGGNL